VPKKGGGKYVSANTELAECPPPEPCSISVGIGTTIIDDLTACFRRTGQYWWEEPSGHDDHHWYTYTIDAAAPDSTASWEVNVETADDYLVEVFVPDNPDSLTAGVTYSTQHGGSISEVVVSHAENRGQWVELGTYAFAEGGDQHVRIVDNTGEPYSDTSGPRLLVDAVRLTSATIPCSDECAGGKRCGDDGWQSCGNFDLDSCLEWGGGGTCEEGTHCTGQGECTPDSSSGGSGGQPIPNAETADGCGCRTAGRSPSSSYAVFLLALLATTRRRLSRSYTKRSA